VIRKRQPQIVNDVDQMKLVTFPNNG